MSLKKEEDYHIRDYEPGDETGIVILFETVFGVRLTEEQWRWKYTNVGSRPPAKLAFNADEQLLGFAGAVSLRGWRQGYPLPFFQICDVMVHPSARGHLGERNLFTQLMRALLSDLAGRYPEAFAYGFPGQRPFRLGEHSRVYGLIETARCVHRPVREHRWSLLCAQPLDWEDMRLGVLWADLAPNFALSLVRDRAYLRWRYAKNPFRHYKLLGFTLAGQLLGCAVLHQEETHLQVVDLLMSRYWLKRALAALDRVAADSGCTEMDIWLPQSWLKAVDGHAEITEVNVANMIWQLSIPTEEVRQSLYYTMGDLDIF